MWFGLKVYHLSCADLRGLSIGGRAMVCHVLLVETPADGIVLVDTGLGRGDYADLARSVGRAFADVYARPRRDPSLAASEQMASLGLRTADVRHIILTHLDFDHSGGLPDFPNARVHLHASEYSAALGRRGFRARQRYRPSVWAHRPRFRTYAAGGERWFGFEGVRDLDGLSPEFLLVPLFGHTLGHCGVAVRGDDGWLLHAGDAYYDRVSIGADGGTYDAAIGLLQAIVTADRRIHVHNQARLRDLILSEPSIRVFCSHDPWEYEAERRRR